MSIVRAAQAGQGGSVTIACINKATVGLGVPFDKLTAALQACYDRYFVPVWGYPVTLYNTGTAKPADWQLIYFDDADQAGALGYHDLTKKGQPVSKIFVKTTLADHELVSVTACHELFEMVIDPIANLWAEASDGTEYAYEMSDPVEEDTFLVDGIQMSNFVHPAWFEPFNHPPGTKFDVVVHDSHEKEVDKRTVTLNEWSSAEWTWKVPDDGVLGSYNIAGKIEKQRLETSGNFLVAAYRRPEFRVDVTLNGE